MDFARYSIALLLLRSDAPEMSPEAQDALQDAHLAYLSSLHDSGELLVAGPVLGTPDRELRGFSIYACDVDRARELAENDPGTLAGRYRHEVHPWMLPAGLMSFTPGHLPRSIVEATG